MDSADADSAPPSMDSNTDAAAPAVAIPVTEAPLTDAAMERERIEKAAEAAQVAVDRVETREMAVEVWIDVAQCAVKQAAADVQSPAEAVQGQEEVQLDDVEAEEEEEAPPAAVDGAPAAAASKDGRKKTKKKPPRTPSPLALNSARAGSAKKSSPLTPKSSGGKKTAAGRLQAELPLSSSRGDRFRAAGSGNGNHTYKGTKSKGKLVPLAEAAEMAPEELAGSSTSKMHAKMEAAEAAAAPAINPS